MYQVNTVYERNATGGAGKWMVEFGMGDQGRQCCPGSTSSRRTVKSSDGDHTKVSHAGQVGPR